MSLATRQMVRREQSNVARWTTMVALVSDRGADGTGAIG